MNDFLKQLSSYNLFNHLFPGTVFCVVLNKLGNFDLIIENLVAALFFYYFIGLTISRVGSLIIDPILKNTGFIKIESYADFIKAEKRDSRIETLSEVNNVYRTLISLPICAGAYWIGAITADSLALPSSLRAAAIFLFFAALFAFSYRKQNLYVLKRINASLDRSSSSP